MPHTRWVTLYNIGSIGVDSLVRLVRREGRHVVSAGLRRVALAAGAGARDGLLLLLLLVRNTFNNTWLNNP